MLGFSVALRPDVLWYAFIGCIVGTLVGMLPGIGPLAGISILLPLTFGLDATNAIVMLAGIYYGSQYGGSTTSILLRIPGEAASVMTCIDGNAMARNGRAGAALCIAAVGSFIAGTFGVIMLTMVAPPLATFALRFGPPEYTALLLLGLIFLAYMSTSSLVRTLLMAAFGLLLGTIGIDVMTGHFRFSFNIARTGRRHRHRAGRGWAVRARRNPRHAEPAGDDRRCPPEIARTAPEQRRMAASSGTNRARIRTRLRYRHHSGVGAYHFQLHVLRAGKADLQELRKSSARARWPASPDRNRPITQPPQGLSCRC